MEFIDFRESLRFPQAKHSLAWVQSVFLSMASPFTTQPMVFLTPTQILRTHPLSQELAPEMAFGIEMLGPMKEALLITPRIILSPVANTMPM
jgi:hypothetical protein